MFKWINDVTELAKENPYTIMTVVFLTVITVLSLRNSTLDNRGRELSDKMVDDCEDRLSKCEEKYEKAVDEHIRTLKQLRAKVYKRLDSIPNETDSY